MKMRRFWITAPSRSDPLHRYDGTVVLAPEDGDTPTVYLMDLSKPNTSLMLPRRNLARWHEYTVGHKHCYCQRHGPAPTVRDPIHVEVRANRAFLYEGQTHIEQADSEGEAQFWSVYLMDHNRLWDHDSDHTTRIKAVARAEHLLQGAPRSQAGDDIDMERMAERADPIYSADGVRVSIIAGSGGIRVREYGGFQAWGLEDHTGYVYKWEKIPEHLFQSLRKLHEESK